MSRIAIVAALCACWMTGCRPETEHAVLGAEEPPMPVDDDEDPGFHWGITLGPSDETTALAAELGCRRVRFDLSWKVVEPMIDNPPLTMADVTEDMIRDYAFNDPTKDWSVADQALADCASRGLRPFVIVGNGFRGHLPDFVTPSGETTLFTPDAGREQYLARLYLFASAAALRYGNRVRYWQLENELNVAGTTVIWGWRRSLAWLDWNFLTQVVTTLRDAVKRHDPTSLVGVNFHAMMPDWVIHLERWKADLDVIGIDWYPNYVFGWPVLGQTLAAPVAIAKMLAPDKRVMVLETGYPTQPASQLFDEARQAEYLTQAVEAARAQGADGFYWFALLSSEEPGETGVSFPFTLLEAVEGYWGLRRSDGTRKPAFDAYRSLIKTVSGPVDVFAP